jgi:hypothetical protein
MLEKTVKFMVGDKVELNVHHYTNLIDGLGRAREYSKVQKKWLLSVQILTNSGAVCCVGPNQCFKAFEAMVREGLEPDLVCMMSAMDQVCSFRFSACPTVGAVVLRRQAICTAPIWWRRSGTWCWRAI